MMNEATDLNVSIIADVFSQLDAKSNNPNPAITNDIEHITDRFIVIVLDLNLNIFLRVALYLKGNGFQKKSILSIKNIVAGIWKMLTGRN